MHLPTDRSGLRTSWPSRTRQDEQSWWNPSRRRRHETSKGREGQRLLGMPGLVDEDVREVSGRDTHGPYLRGSRAGSRAEQAFLTLKLAPQHKWGDQGRDRGCCKSFIVPQHNWNILIIRVPFLMGSTHLGRHEAGADDDTD